MLRKITFSFVRPHIASRFLSTRSTNPPLCILKSILDSTMPQSTQLFTKLPVDQRQAHVLHLAATNDPFSTIKTVSKILTSSTTSCSTLSHEEVLAIRNAVTPEYEKNLERIMKNGHPNVLEFLIQLREDVLFVQSKPSSDTNSLRTLSQTIHKLLTHFFSLSLLQFRQITYADTPALTIEKIAKKEQVSGEP